MPTTPDQVAEAFERTGAAWVLADPQREQILAGVARQIDEFLAAYEQRFRDTPAPFELLRHNVPKATAFFQTFTGPPHSVEMRLMIWRVLLGSEIIEVRFDYAKGSASAIVIVTATPSGEREEFRSNDLWDFRVFRHIGIVGGGGHPILDGYYALRNSNGRGPA